MKLKIIFLSLELLIYSDSLAQSVVFNIDHTTPQHLVFIGPAVYMAADQLGLNPMLSSCGLSVFKELADGHFNPLDALASILTTFLAERNTGLITFRPTIGLSQINLSDLALEVSVMQIWLDQHQQFYLENQFGSTGHEVYWGVNLMRSLGWWQYGCGLKFTRVALDKEVIIPLRGQGDLALSFKISALL